MVNKPRKKKKKLVITLNNIVLQNLRESESTKKSVINKKNKSVSLKKKD